MAIINLRPEAGEELAQIVNTTLDDRLCSTLENLYGACRKMGDENHLVIDITGKYHKAQDVYNSQVLPAVNNYKQVLGQYTDYATYHARLQADDTVKDVNVGTINTGAFDAAHDL